MKTNQPYSWDATMFLIAGLFLLLNTVLLWVRYFSDFQLSIMWPAIPAITAFTFSLVGLLKLYPRVSLQAQSSARGGLLFAMLASLCLCLAAIWIFAVALFGEGLPDPTPPALSALIALFMISMVFAFLSYGIAFLKQGAQKKAGVLLLVPVSMWALMLLVASFKGMETALSLDYYTNGVIALAFMAIGIFLKKSPGKQVNIVD